MKALLAAVSLLPLLAAAPAWAQNAPNAQPQALSSQDKTFLTEALGGNRAEVALGRLAERQAATPAVKEFGRWMATDHRLANRRLMMVARRLGQSVQPTPTQQDTALKNKLQGLSGAQFDHQYVQAMVRDHAKDVRAFRQEAQDGQARPLKLYARALLPVIRQHLAEAKELAGEGGVAGGAGTAGAGSSTAHENR